MKSLYLLTMLAICSSFAMGQCDHTYTLKNTPRELIAKMDCLVAENNKLKQAAATPGNGHWEHYIHEAKGGEYVASWLTKKGRNPSDVVVSYDGAHNTFHVWLRGSDAGRRYDYRAGSSDDLKEGSQASYFLSNDKTLFIGIGGANNVAVPIYIGVY